MNIDEINAYANGDGTYKIEVHLWDEGHNGQITVTIPFATIDFSVSTGGCLERELEMTMRGTMK